MFDYPVLNFRVNKKDEKEKDEQTAFLKMLI